MEALAQVYRLTSKTTLPGSIEKLFSDPACQSLTPQSSDFWVLVHAVMQFTRNEGEGRLPVSGVVPDMHSDTKSFVLVQTLYVLQKISDF